MPENEQEKHKKNQEIVEALRNTFAPLAQRLTPDVEPAMIFLPCIRTSATATSEHEE